MSTCDVQTLLSDGREFGSLPPGDQMTAELALLAKWAGFTGDPQELLEAGKCFGQVCTQAGDQMTAQLQLLCQIASAVPEPPVTETPTFGTQFSEPITSPYGATGSVTLTVLTDYDAGNLVSWKLFAVGDPYEEPTPGSNGWSDYGGLPGIAVDLTANFSDSEIRAVALAPDSSMSEVATLVAYNNVVSYSALAGSPDALITQTGAEHYQITGVPQVDPSVATIVSITFIPVPIEQYTTGMSITNNLGFTRTCNASSTATRTYTVGGVTIDSNSAVGPTRGGSITAGGTLNFSNAGSSYATFSGFGTVTISDNAAIISCTGTGTVPDLYLDQTFPVTNAQTANTTVVWTLVKLFGGKTVNYNITRTYP